MSDSITPDQAHDTTIYQLDYLITSKGKRIAASKRRIRWRFGFADEEAIDRGLCGTECRGKEHEVVIIWSRTSGKQRILADGVEVHFAKSSVLDKFECAWTMKGGQELKVVAHAGPAIFQPKGSHRFDLLINGQSYWNLPKISQVGAMPSIPRSKSIQEHLLEEQRQSRSFPSRRVHSSPNLMRYSVPTASLLSFETQSSSSKIPNDVASPTGVMDGFTALSAAQSLPLGVTTGQPQQYTLVSPDPSVLFGAQQFYHDNSDLASCCSSQAPVYGFALAPEMTPAEIALHSLVDLDGPLDSCSPLDYNSPNESVTRHYDYYGNDIERAPQPQQQTPVYAR